MSYYTNTQHGLCWLPEGDSLPEGGIAITDAEAAVLKAAADAAQAPVKLKAAATVALVKSDTTLLRCAESAVAIPPEWAAYRKALRNIVSGADTTSVALPTQPAYPAGT